jgi:hypothetical protein
VGAQRLQRRFCRLPGGRRPAGRRTWSPACVLDFPAAVHARLRAVRPGSHPGCADPRPGRPGRRSRHAHPELAGDSPRFAPGA